MFSLRAYTALPLTHEEPFSRTRCKNPSFLSKILLSTDSKPAITTAAVLEWCLGHFRILFAISPWKASRLLIMALFSSQFSLPKRSTGITQVSTTDLEESGLRSPWNAPMPPYAKKALLAFLMFSVMARVASKSLCHQKPRRFLAYPVGRVTPPTAHG